MSPSWAAGTQALVISSAASQDAESAGEQLDLEWLLWCVRVQLQVASCPSLHSARPLEKVGFKEVSKGGKE